MTNAVDDREFNYSHADFEEIRSAIYKIAGINLSDSKKQLVYSRLARRLRALRLPDFAHYLVYLKENHEEQEEFVNALTTNLTAFFREPHHFTVLADYAKKNKQTKRPLRIWCSASSTGEEPYSIAMTMAEVYGNYEPPVEIIASDIDSNVLREASLGVYPISRLDSVSQTQKQQFFQRGKGENLGKARIVPALRRLIDFRKINLLDTNWGIESGLDIIFCRNVMIYFDKPTQIILLEKMIRLLNPQGLYIAGHSESFSQSPHLVKLVGRTTYAPAVRQETGDGF